MESAPFRRAALNLPEDLPRLVKSTGAPSGAGADPGLRRARCACRLMGSGWTWSLSCWLPLIVSAPPFRRADLVIGVESQPFFSDTGIPAIARTRNLLPILSFYEPGRSFQEWARSLAAWMQEAQTHRHMPLAELLHLLSPA
ncbi:MAG: hypothetical protein IPN59_17545 [Holophaga sp.]|nr:hypothetical protein [Holophaga sp.]